MTGYIAIAAPGNYDFTQFSDDNTTFSIGGQLVASTYYRNPETTTVTFATAGLYPIAIAYNQGAGRGYYKLSLDGGTTPIPTAQLYATPEPASLALLSVSGLGLLARRRRI